MSDTTCFGLYNDSAVCQVCKAARRCHSVTSSAGLDVVAGALEQLTATIPEGRRYIDTDRMSEVLDQLVRPPLATELSGDDEDMLALLPELENPGAEVTIEDL